MDINSKCFIGNADPLIVNNQNVGLSGSKVS